MTPLNRGLSTLAVAGALGLASVAPAQAGPVESEAAMQAIQSAGLDSVHVSVSDEGIATFTGTVGDEAESNRAVKAVRRADGVKRVVDLTHTAAD